MVLPPEAVSKPYWQDQTHLTPRNHTQSQFISLCTKGTHNLPSIAVRSGLYQEQSLLVSQQSQINSAPTVIKYGQEEICDWDSCASRS